MENVRKSWVPICKTNSWRIDGKWNVVVLTGNPCRYRANRYRLLSLFLSALKWANGKRSDSADFDWFMRYKSCVVPDLELRFLPIFQTLLVSVAGTRIWFHSAKQSVIEPKAPPLVGLHDPSNRGFASTTFTIGVAKRAKVKGVKPGCNVKIRRMHCLRPEWESP